MSRYKKFSPKTQKEVGVVGRVCNFNKDTKEKDLNLATLCELSLFIWLSVWQNYPNPELGVSVLELTVLGPTTLGFSIFKDVKF